MATPRKGHGVVLACEFVTDTYTTIGRRVTISGPTMSVPEIPTTNLDSTAQESIPGLPDFGSVSFDIQFDPTDTVHEDLFDMVGTPVVKNWRVTVPTLKQYDYAGYVTAFDLSGMETDSIITGSLTVRITGTVTPSTPA